MIHARTEKCLFKSAGGLSLEGEIARPESPPFGTMILCHPHPLYGGEMRNPIVETLFRGFPREGLLTFRFNFRGVGNSEGYFAEGIGEAEDLRGAIRFLSDLGYGPLPCFLTGYSFGAYVIHLLTPFPPHVRGIIWVSPPVSMSEFQLERFPECPTLIISGDRDPFCRPSTLERLVQPHRETVTHTILPGIDHFWIGRGDLLMENLRTWVRARIGSAI